MESTRELKIGLTFVAIALLLMFSSIGTSTLLGMVVAAALIVLGVVSYSRPTGVIGLLIASGSAAASLGQQSLTVVGNLLNMVIGLLAPVLILAWVALSAEEQQGPILVRRKPAILTAIYAAACMLSVGLVALSLGVLSPSISVGMPALMEISIILLTATLGVILLTSGNPRPAVLTEQEPEPSAPEE